MFFDPHFESELTRFDFFAIEKVSYFKIMTLIKLFEFLNKVIAIPKVVFLVIAIII